MLTVYLAGPITGMTYSRAVDWREEFGLMNSRIRTLSPMRGKDYLKQEFGDKALPGTVDYRRSHVMSTDDAIYARDLWDVRRSDVVVANFLGAKERSSGTTFELGFARALGKLIILVIEPDGSNPNDSVFIRKSANFTVHSLNDAEMLLESIA